MNEETNRVHLLMLKCADENTETARGLLGVSLSEGELVSVILSLSTVRGIINSIRADLIEGRSYRNEDLPF